MPEDERGDVFGSLLNRSISAPSASAEEAVTRLRAAELRPKGLPSSEYARALGDSDGSSPWVYVPAHPVIKDGTELAEYELRELTGYGWS